MAGSEESACKSACRSASYRQPGKQKPRLSGAFEEGLLARDQRLLNPLDPIEGGFWDVIKLDPPAALFEEADALARIRDVSRRTDQTNEMIRSREAFRVGNQALSGFSGQLERYDKLLETWLSELLDALNDLKPVLEAARESVDAS